MSRRRAPSPAKNLVIGMVPAKDQDHAGLRQQLSSFANLTLASSASITGTYTLDPFDIAAWTDGKLFFVKVPVPAGALLNGTLFQRNAANVDQVASVPLTIEAGYAIYRSAAPAAAGTTKFVVTVQATATATTIEDIGVSLWRAGDGGKRGATMLRVIGSQFDNVSRGRADPVDLFRRRQSYQHLDL